jgi:phage tail sheath protein FI
MPVTPTYPGIYIEEVPSSARTITAAATSVTVFVGYTHPFKTRPTNWGRAVRLFSFTEYEREFGGLFASGVYDRNLAYAVNAFFLNGGSDAYVVALRPQFRNGAGGVIGGADATVGPQATAGGIVFTSLEPTETGQTQLNVTITPPPGAGPFDVADVTLAYGSRVETFRRVRLGVATTDPDHVETRLNRESALVRVSAPGGGYPATFTAVNQQAIVFAPPAGFATTFSGADFAPVFAQDSDLDKVSIFNLLVLPGISDNAVLSAALAFAERKQAFVIVDPPANFGRRRLRPARAGDRDLRHRDAAAQERERRAVLPVPARPGPAHRQPDGAAARRLVAGVYARTDTNRGVWKAPAGLETTVLGTTGVVARGRMTDPRQGVLNPLGVNALRDFPGVGTVIFGARTLVTANPAFQQSRYVPVRRMTLFIEQTLYRNLGWVVFEPNDEPLWVAIRTSIETFLLGLFQQGAFQGATPRQAFQVKCDATTTTQADIDNGIVNIVVAFAPLKPAEFVIVKIAHLAGQSQS